MSRPNAKNSNYIVFKALKFKSLPMCIWLYGIIKCWIHTYNCLSYRQLRLFKNHEIFCKFKEHRKKFIYEDQCTIKAAILSGLICRTLLYHLSRLWSEGQKHFVLYWLPVYLPIMGKTRRYWYIRAKKSIQLGVHTWRQNASPNT